MMVNRICLRWLCALCLSMAVGMAGASAKTLPQAVTIGELLRVVREKSPRYAALRTQIETARAEGVAAGLLPNPRFSYGRYDLLSRRNSMYDGSVQENYTLEVPVLIAGQRSARVRAAERRIEAAEAQADADFSELIRAVWQSFVELLAQRQRVAALEDAVGDIEHLRTIVSGREQAGSASPYDVLRIDVEAREVETRLETARGDLAGAAGSLGVLLGLPDWRPDARGELAPLGIPADAQGLWAQAEQKNPALEAARRGETAADAGLEQARRERWPTPSILVGTAFTDRPYGMTSFAGVAVDLPLFDRGQGGMAKAAAEKQAAALERQLVTAQMRLELERAVDLLARRRASRAKFEREVLQKLPDLKRMGENAYRLGKGTLLELLDAARSRTEIRLTHLDLMQAEVDAELSALKAAGLLIDTVERNAK
jgi:cobalt-zinc-cadmium efflux system outer membrane protein